MPLSLAVASSSDLTFGPEMFKYLQGTRDLGVQVRLHCPPIAAGGTPLTQDLREVFCNIVRV